MRKAGHLRITILVLTLCLGLSSGILAQVARDTIGFSWRLLEVTDPSSEAKIQFTPRVPAPALFTNWDFGDGSPLSTDSIATHSFTTLNTFDVDYNFKLETNDSTITHSVIANSAAFFERLDSNTNVTYTRILRSAYWFPSNDLSIQGSMRFEWSVDGEVLTDVNYIAATDGQYPNIRYTFETSGNHTVTLKAWNTANPTNTCEHTRTINIAPDFATKVKFSNIPNVFTPNGDGVFDSFIVQTSGLSRLVFKVFTRTGVLIYQNEAYYISWDGKNDNGKDLPEGIYYYIIEDIDKLYENAKGFVYIFRGK
ncbi:MAG: hypothetical protein EHM93_06385 [Bacteroidales bacterium]|nr:MAG: hypothetical protein EHM93_06385 [Bacteroidales bacterium]